MTSLKEANGSEKPEEAASDDKQETRCRVARIEHGIEPRKAGGQPKHPGRSQNGKPTCTIRLVPDLCRARGTVPDKVVKIIRIRMHYVNRREEEVTCVMCVMYVLGW